MENINQEGETIQENQKEIQDTAKEIISRLEDRLMETSQMVCSERQ